MDVGFPQNIKVGGGGGSPKNLQCKPPSSGKSVFRSSRKKENKNGRTPIKLAAHQSSNRLTLIDCPLGQNKGF